MEKIADIAAAGNLVFVAFSTHGVDIIDISDPVRPKAYVKNPVLECPAKVLFATETHLYVGSAMELQVLDYSFWPVMPQMAAAVAVAGGVSVLHVAPGFVVSSDRVSPYINVFRHGKDLSKLKLVHKQRTRGVVSSIGIRNNFAFVANTASSTLSGLEIFNLANFTRVGFITTRGDARQMFVQGAFVYLAELNSKGQTVYGSSLKIVDTSSPARPKIMGELETPGYALQLYVKESLAWVVATDHFDMVDVSRPRHPRLLYGSRFNFGVVRRFAVTGRYAALLSLTGLHVMDLKCTAAPTSAPSSSPTAWPTHPTSAPTLAPSQHPTSWNFVKYLSHFKDGVDGTRIETTLAEHGQPGHANQTHRLQTHQQQMLWAKQFMDGMKQEGSCTYHLIKHECLRRAPQACEQCAQQFVLPRGSCDKAATQFLCWANQPVLTMGSSALIDTYSDCVGHWGKWGDCDCKRERKMRKYVVVKAAAGGGKPCATYDQEEECHETCRPTASPTSKPTGFVPPPATRAPTSYAFASFHNGLEELKSGYNQGIYTGKLGTSTADLAHIMRTLRITKKMHESGAITHKAE